MTFDPKRKITITSEEVGSKKVDEALASQMSFGMPAPEAPAQKAVWYYSTWFVLMCAGTIGALLAWMCIEPFFDDGITFTGRVESVNPESRIPGSPVRGQLEAAGVTVYFLDAVTELVRADGTVEALDPERVRTDQVVRVYGELYSANPPMVAAYQITELPGAQEPDEFVSLSEFEIQSTIIGLLLFPTVAGFVGLAIGAADGLISRAFSRALISGLIGLGMGLLVGMVSIILGGLLYSAAQGIAFSMDDSTDPMKLSTGAFLVQMMGRGLAWAIAGSAMGLGQGVAMRSRKLLLNGLVGGVLGGLIGGLLFDPINYAAGGGRFFHNAASSRAVGFGVIGLSVGLMIGIVELIAREAWLKMLAGPLAGKEFVLYRDPTTIGSSPKREVYLFKDPDVEPVHAKIHRVGEGYEIEDAGSAAGTLVNGRKARRQRLANQDQIRIGSTVLLFTMKED